MNARVLFVDDDPNLLSGLKRGLRGQFEIETATSGAEGLEAIATRPPYAVIVSDMRMPGMDGIQFLAAARQRTPDTVRIMLTGYSDVETAIEAVNEGHIFRFLCKPCPIEQLAKALSAGVEQHRLVTAEKELLSKTLCGSIKVLADVLALASPTAFGRAARVRRLVQQLAGELNLSQPWELEVAATLSQIGLLALPPEALDKLYHGRPLNADESRMFASHPAIGRDLVANIPRLERIAQIIAYQEQNFDGTGIPGDGLSGTAIPLGARVLKIALDYDAHCMAGCSPAEAIMRMRQHGERYDPAVMAALQAVVRVEGDYEICQVKVTQLRPNMIIAEDVRTTTGVLLVSRGQEATASLRERLHNFARNASITEPIRVLVPAGHAAPAARPTPGSGPKPESCS